MHTLSTRIADILLEVEAILRTSGRWDKQRPPEGALASKKPFCIDTLQFEQWLQWVFLPRMKAILEEEHPLPGQSEIHVYAREYLDADVSANDVLLARIRDFDELITGHSGEPRH